MKERVERYIMSRRVNKIGALTGVTLGIKSTHMSAYFRVYLLSGVLALTILSCSPANPTVRATNIPTPQIVSENPIATAIPKQKDLIFIEFFAGT